MKTLTFTVIKTHGHVSVTKEAMWCTSVLFTGTVNLLFSTARISITTGLISIKFTYFMSSIYSTLYTKFEKIGQVVHEKCVHEIIPFSSHFSSFLHRFTKVALSQPKTLLPWNDFFQIWHTYKALCGLC